MLIHCDFCEKRVSSCVKMPCGYITETFNGQTLLLMPNDEEVYRNICVKCLFDSSKELEEE